MYCTDDGEHYQTITKLVRSMMLVPYDTGDGLLLDKQPGCEELDNLKIPYTGAGPLDHDACLLFSGEF